MRKTLIVVLLSFASCTAPQFVVTSKRAGAFEGSCVATIKPINISARMKGKVNQALIGCGDYEVGDTLFLKREEFTNF